MIVRNNFEFKSILELRKKTILSQKSAEFYGLERRDCIERTSIEKTIWKIIQDKNLVKPLLVGCVMQIIQQLTGLI